MTASLAVNNHYSDVTMGAVASQITSVSIVYSTVYPDACQRKPQSSVSLAFVRVIHRSPVNSPHKEPVTRTMFPFDDVIIMYLVIAGNDNLTRDKFGLTTFGKLNWTYQVACVYHEKLFETSQTFDQRLWVGTHIMSLPCESNFLHCDQLVPSLLWHVVPSSFP